MTWKLPELGENVEQATVLQVLVHAGDTVNKDQPVLEVETDKVTVEVPCTVSGKVTDVHVKAGEQVRTGQVVLTIDGTAVRDEAARIVLRPNQPPQVASDRPSSVVPRVSPLTRKLARELGVTLEEIPGSGPNGEIFLDDVKEYARDLLEKARRHRRSPLPDFSKWGATRREALSQIRAKTSERMTTAWTTIPHVTHFDEADITRLEAQRKKWNTTLQPGAPKLTVTAILLPIISAALKTFPQFNASLDVARQEIVYKDYVNIGVAVDTTHGLLVPVVKAVDTKVLATLVNELATLAEKARARTLGVDDVQGAGFTITNLGGIGGTNFTPIVNPPEVAILAISRSKAVGQKLIMPLGLSYDHRLIDGADAARFVRYVVEKLETAQLKK